MKSSLSQKLYFNVPEKPDISIYSSTVYLFFFFKRLLLNLSFFNLVVGRGKQAVQVLPVLCDLTDCLYEIIPFQKIYLSMCRKARYFQTIFILLIF
jgi:hypothetical protein